MSGASTPGARTESDEEAEEYFRDLGDHGPVTGARIPTSGSSVPLANTNVSPLDLQELSKRLQQEQNNPPPRSPPNPTRSQMSGIAMRKVAEEVGKNRAKAATVRQKQQVQKIHEQMSQTTNADQAANVMLCNAYREKYQKVHPKYPWKPRYTVDMDPAFIEKELTAIRLLINSSDLPAFLSTCMIEGSRLLETASQRIGNQYFNLAHLHANVVELMKNKHFESELDQLSIELQPFLAQDPKTRLAYKCAQVIGTVLMSNMPKPVAPSKTPRPAVTKGL